MTNSMPPKKHSIKENRRLPTDYIVERRLQNTVKNNSRLSPCLPTIIQPSQHCGIRGRSIFDTVATVREVIALAETARKPICVVSLDFSAAFDKVTHTYMEEAIKAHGFDTKFTECIMNLYGNASSEV